MLPVKQHQGLESPLHETFPDLKGLPAFNFTY